MSPLKFDLQFKSMNEIAFHLIREKIQENELKPGDRLDVDQLAELLKMSRTPVTNALKELDHKGYVTIQARSGSYVRRYTKEEIENIFDFREVMEQLVVKKTIELADPAVLAGYKAQFEELLERDLGDADCLDQFLNIEMAFHQYLMNLCPSIIRNELQNLMDLTKRIRKLHLHYLIEKKGESGVTRSQIRIHLELADAILRRDYRTADHLIMEDITFTKREILDNYEVIEEFGLGN